MERVNKIMVGVQGLVIVATLMFVFMFAPRLESPGDGSIIDGNVVNFKFDNANIIWVDDNKEFSSPMEIDLDKDDVSAIKFKPGTYYWKAIGFIESPVREFVVTSEVGLELDRENVSLKNVGDVILNISVGDSLGLEGLVILDVDVEYGVDIENETYRGEQYG